MKKTIKAITAVGCAALLCVAMAGCGGNNNSGSSNSGSSQTTQSSTQSSTSGSSSSSSTSGSSTSGTSTENSDLVKNFVGSYTLIEMKTSDGKEYDEEALEEQGWNYVMTLKEDGTYTIDQQAQGSVSGTWTPKDETTITIAQDGDASAAVDVTVKDGEFTMELLGNSATYALDK